MIFYNEGIFLTTNEGDILNDLKYLESQGVDIVSCGTCLDFFNRKELLQVGAVTNMYDIVERMRRLKKLSSHKDKMKDLVIVRGGGDIATGTIYKLFKCGFKVLILEIEKPSAIRRNVAFCEAIYDTQNK